MALVGVVLAACTSSTRPAPQLRRVVPGELQQGIAVEVRLEGEALFAELRDAYWSGQPAAIDTGFQLWIGEREIDASGLRAIDPTQLLAQLPADLAAGTHAVRVRTPSGREATLPDGLVISELLQTVVQIEDAAAGFGTPVQARTLIAGSAALELHAVRRGQTGRFLEAVPSDWALTADVGPLVVSDDGTSATLAPARAGTAVVTATPRAGGAAASAGPLTVEVPDLVLAFVEGPAALTAGECAGPLTVATQRAGADLSGVSSVAVTLAGSVEGVSFHLQPDCSDVATTAAEIPAGGARATVSLRATRSGALTVTAQASGAADATRTWDVAAGAATSFVWDAIGPQRAATAFAVGVRALDAFGNVATGFAGNAALTLVGEGTLSCPSGCASATTTTAFVGGAWSGQVQIAATAGGDRTLVATAGAVRGESAAFGVVSGRSPPLGRLSASPAVAAVGATVTFDASGSSDYQSAASELQYSWDFTGGGTWTDWSSSPTATHTFAIANYYVARVAVRDPDGDIGYKGTLVVINPVRCTITEPVATADDGATDCTTNLGTGGTLSLAEALRLTAGSLLRRAIRIPAGLTVRGPASFSIGGDTWIVGERGAAVSEVQFNASGTLVLSGLDVFAASSPVTVASGGFVALHGLTVHDSGPITVAGELWVYRSRFERCDTQCMLLNASGSSLLIRASEVTGSVRGVYATNCNGQGLDIASTAFLGNVEALGVETACGRTAVANVTFHGNTTALDLAGSNHSLRNAIFTANALAVRCRGNWTAADRLLLDGNLDDSCVPAGATNVTRAPPQYLFPSLGDYRTTLGSPAANGGADVGIDVNDVAPGNFTGSAPDLGAYDVW